MFRFKHSKYWVFSFLSDRTDILNRLQEQIWVQWLKTGSWKLINLPNSRCSPRTLLDRAAVWGRGGGNALSNGAITICHPGIVTSYPLHSSGHRDQCQGHYGELESEDRIQREEKHENLPLIIRWRLKVDVDIIKTNCHITGDPSGAYSWTILK